MEQMSYMNGTNVEGITKFTNKIGKEVYDIINFPAKGTFEAVGEAQNYLKKKYVIGSMERGLPIGFADITKYDYVSKWTKMDTHEHKLLSGVIISEDFREGDVTIIFWK